MPREKLKGIKIPSLDDDVFASDEKKALDNAEKVIEIKLNKITDFPSFFFFFEIEFLLLKMEVIRWLLVIEENMQVKEMTRQQFQR